VTSTPTGRRFDAVLFDAGGVLVLPDPTVLGPLLVAYGGDASEAAHRRAHYAAMATKSMVGAGETNWRDYDVAYVKAVGVEARLEALAAEVLGATRSAHLWRWPIPESMRALVALAELGIPMGVVSNATGLVEAELLRGRICQVGDGHGAVMRCVVDSHVVGVAKPDPQIFDHALACFPEFPRERIAYVGDSVKMDVGGARSAGLHPILVDPHDDHAGADFDRIRSLAELVELFR
jgi:putative hydrolase of the HAD superfamily